MISAHISISLPPFDEKTLNLSFPCNEPTIATHKRNTIARVLMAAAIL
jgi:hypothetical protein